jgi:peptidyl-tRNA hydrolase, PTH1 family
VILVVGLGNPGPRYAATRHNLGFHVVDELARRAGSGVFRSRFQGQIAELELGGHKLRALKPETFMNLSGESVQAAAHFYKTPPSDVLVAHDELDLPLGQVRLKTGGGEAGHNGLRSITQHLGTDKYHRLRLGIGRPPPEFRGSGADFVLETFAPTEQPLAIELVERAVEAVLLVADHGVAAAMNKVNQKAKS